MKKTLWAFLILICVGLQPVWAEDEGNKVQLSLIADVESVQPGVPFQVGLYFEIEKGWHTYYKDPGESGAPPQFKWQLPKGFQLGELQWPKYKELVEPGNIRVNAYKKELLLWAEVIPPKNSSKKEISFNVDANWLVCADVCIPESTSLSLTLSVSNQVAASANQDLFNQFQQPTEEKSDLIRFLFFAFIGGLILNIMPCVLPVVSLKILSFVRMAQEDRKRIALLGGSFSLGVLASFMALATVVVVLKNIGQDVGWGFQFQHPEFVVILTAVIFVLGLSLAGLFELTLSVPQKGVSLTQKEGLGGAFFYGVLATILATPCTAPFVGVTIGFAFSSSNLNIFLIFLTMGIGLAFPFLLLSLNPAWTRLIPKPGAWMEVFKEFMAFLLFATVVWLLWVVGKQLGVDALVLLLGFLVLLGFIFWIWGKAQFQGKRKRVMTLVLLLIVLLVGVKYFLNPVLRTVPGQSKMISKEGGIAWKEYNPEAFQQALKEGKKVFLDFTADWCLTCKVNEKTVLNTKDVIASFSEKNIVAFKLDWTFQDKEVTALLKSFNRFGVPLYVYYPKGNQTEPIILPEVLTKKILLDAVEK